MAPADLSQANSHIAAFMSDYERFKCHFAASVDSDASSESSGRKAAELPLLDNDSPERRSAIFFSNAVGAAWALTLQCFIVADVLPFAWHSFADTTHLNHGKQYHREPHRICCVHIDRADTVSDLVRSFSFAPPSSASKVLYSSGQGSKYQCNTSAVVRSTPVVSDGGTPGAALQADLSLSVFHSYSSSGTARLEYRTNHTSSDMALSVLETFCHILAQILYGPSDMYVRDIGRCPEEHHSIIKKSTTFKASVANQCLHDLIIAQCERRPRSLAVLSSERCLTYGELNDLSAKLALHLQKLGLQPETFVLCCFNKSVWAIIARLAILRAGAAYISVHADYPPSYLGSVLQQTEAQMLLTDETSAAKFEGVLPHMVILSHGLFERLESPAYNVIRANVAPDNACLVLFTSGSTGTPKGIVQTHRAYASGITKYAQDLGLSKDTRYLQFDDYAFDISNVEFLTPLILGGCCIVPGRITNIRDLAFEINSKQANIAFLTPTVAIKLDPADVPQLRNLCVGGEPLSRDLIVKWKESETRLHCQYGMSEAAVCCALNAKLCPAAGNVVGRPSTGTIWIADPLSVHKPMPVGSCGEIIIEGPHLARGYLGPSCAKRSNAGFLKTLPLWMTKMHHDRASTMRLYRSGDLGRLNFDGTISYLGRKDTILKLDGCRIDAQEIEHLARRHLSPEDTIIVDLLGVPGSRSDPILTAMIYCEDGKGLRCGYSVKSGGDVTFHNGTLNPVIGPKIEMIKRTIAQSLPPYMVPRLFLSMSAIPRTSSKKIDRKKVRQCAQVWYVETLEKSRNRAACEMAKNASVHAEKKAHLLGLTIDSPSIAW